MASQTINQLANAHSLIRCRRRMSADQHSESVRIHLLDNTCKLYITINRRSTGVEHKELSIRSFLLHTLQRLLLVHLLSRSINKCHFKTILFSNAGRINQPKGIIQNAAMTYGGASGFTRKLAVFSLERRVDKTYFHFDSPSFISSSCI